MISAFSFPADWNLEIKNVTLEDDATFQCQISQVPLVSRKAVVTVWVKPDPPVIVDGPVAQVELTRELWHHLTSVSHLWLFKIPLRPLKALGSLGTPKEQTGLPVINGTI